MASSVNNSHKDLDTVSIPQHLLDLETRVRTNVFPWRGQFSPGLVELFLSKYVAHGEMVFDPFAGVGTTLMEAARQQHRCYGTEINPAAVAMAETVMFIGLPMPQRQKLLRSAERKLLAVLPASDMPLFNSNAPTSKKTPLAHVVELAKYTDLNSFERNIVTNVLIRIADDEASSVEAVSLAFRQHSAIIERLPHSTEQCCVENVDARQAPLEDVSVDFVFTSPPYLNVFNYHQNNRRAMELLGWDLLDVAKSEFGSNRKHRGNRFLTVVQYCLDMSETLLKVCRVLKRHGRAIFVVGRESSIRGVSFQNGYLVSSLAAMCGLELHLRQERKFKNKFGEVIYEDILHFIKAGKASPRHANIVQLAISELEARLDLDLKPDIESDLRAAIKTAPEILPSPMYKSKAAALPHKNRRSA